MGLSIAAIPVVVGIVTPPPLAVGVRLLLIGRLGPASGGVVALLESQVRRTVSALRVMGRPELTGPDGRGHGACKWAGARELGHSSLGP